MAILLQFALRTTFGLALAMAFTSPRRVTSGFFRNHSYVLLGMSVVAVLASWVLRRASLDEQPTMSLALPVAAAVLSYLSSAVWLYERAGAGRILLLATALAALAGAWTVPIVWQTALTPAWVSQVCNAPTSGLVLGTTLAAMFLGHWYLNSPTMELAPLRLLLWAMLLALALRAAFCVAGATVTWESLDRTSMGLLALRWLGGLLGPAALALMALETLKIPNTQSATGILYVAVVGTLAGELISLLLSGSAGYPL